jgi:hypothetical protein
MGVRFVYLEVDALLLFDCFCLYVCSFFLVAEKKNPKKGQANLPSQAYRVDIIPSENGSQAPCMYKTCQDFSPIIKII